MGVEWSHDRVLALAPDASSAKSGKDLAASRKWLLLGRSESVGVIWGMCQGSGASPYQTHVELSVPAFHCSCPSRKFPCKHGIGLLLLHAGDVSAFAESEAPPWVGAWLEGRAKRAEQKATKEQSKQEKIERGEAGIDSAARGKREETRKAKVAAGLNELNLWLMDLARQGLASTHNLPPRAWEERARRLIDAQAPGIARRVGRIHALPMTGAESPVTVFRELRAGQTGDGKTKIKQPSGTMSTREAISVMNQGLALAAHFGDGVLRAQDVASGLTGAVVKDPVQDRVVWLEYLETVVKERDGWIARSSRISPKPSSGSWPAWRIRRRWPATLAN
jgi:hypothetical protein